MSNNLVRLRDRGAHSQGDLVADWVGGKRGYLWLGRHAADGGHQYLTAMSYGQAKALLKLLNDQIGAGRS